MPFFFFVVFAIRFYRTADFAVIGHTKGPFGYTNSLNFRQIFKKIGQPNSRFMSLAVAVCIFRQESVSILSKPNIVIKAL